MSAWMITATGRDHVLQGPAVPDNQPTLAEIAHSLAQINRFTGHCSRPYSVAEHSLLVATLARDDGHSPLLQMACLMHDAHEAFCGDVSSPAKHAIGSGWADFESDQARQLRKRFGLQTVFAAQRAIINRYDLIALASERRDLTAYRPQHNAPWPILDTPGAQVDGSWLYRLDTALRVTFTWLQWREAFLKRHAELQACIAKPSSASTEATAP